MDAADDASVEFDALDAQGRSALHVAALLGNGKMLTVLLRSNRCDVNLRTRDARATALILACVNGRKEAGTFSNR